MRGRRREAQPSGIKTFGSTFKNPDDPRAEGRTAGLLLSEAGCNGLAVGGARFSPKHANFVENIDDATTADVLAVMAEGRRRVHERFGVELEPEVQVLGDAEWPQGWELRGRNATDGEYQGSHPGGSHAHHDAPLWGPGQGDGKAEAEGRALRRGDPGEAEEQDEDEAQGRAALDQAGAGEDRPRRRGAQGTAADPHHALQAGPPPTGRGGATGPPPVSWRSRLILGIVLLAALGCGYLFWLRDSSLVAVDNVKVAGVTAGDTQQVVGALENEAETMTTLHVRAERIERVAATFPTVASVSVDTNFPHGMTITVHERPPAMIVRTPDEEMPVAADGTILTGVEAPKDEATCRC